MEIGSLRMQRSYRTESDIVISFSGKEYEIGAVIDAGGNAAVHECLSLEGEQLAIKFLLFRSKNIKARFSQEIELLASIVHPHIIRYCDHGEIPVKLGTESFCLPFVIMERADKNLVDYLKKNTSIPYEVYAPQFRGLCSGLSKLHEIAIHRDIKPENILIKGDTWLLSDFGLCSYLVDSKRLDITQTHGKIGPNLWMSPEALNKIYFGSHEIGPYSDVFQLCSVFWFVLARSHPLGLLCETDRPDCEDAIYQIIVQSLSHDYSARPFDGEALYRRMEEATLGCGQ